MRINNFIWIVLLGLTISCVDPIELNISSSESRLVVYGVITNEQESQFIKLNRSTDFQDHNEYPTVNDAEVYLLDLLNVRIDFVEDEGTGIYYAPDDFEILTGDAFELHVLTQQGEHIVSSTETVRSLSQMISINKVAILSPDEYEVDPLDDNYYLSALIDDKEGIRNYYRWKIYINGELRGASSEIILFNDIVSDGVLFRYNADNVLFKEDDIVSLKYYSLTNNAYRFFQLLQDQTENDALETSSPKPVSIESNLVNINDEDDVILGVFSVAQMQIFQGINN